MHFHLPKPLHGWRAFVGEVGIIVIGVLIALAAEAVVQRLDWNDKVRAGREALRADYVTILANSREREGEDRCIRARLLELRNLLDAHADLLPALGHIGSPPGRPWYPRSWDGLIASDVSTHMPRDQMLAFASIAAQARSGEDAAHLETEDWATLYTMVGPARTLAPGEAAQLRKALSDAAFQLNSIRLIAPQVSQSILDTGLLTRTDLQEAQKEGAHSLRGPNARHICGPILPPDPSRVDAPYDPFVQPNPLFGRAEQEKH
jgi:hypothetical protein